jgi:hypothetical protein
MNNAKQIVCLRRTEKLPLSFIGEMISHGSAWYDSQEINFDVKLSVYITQSNSFVVAMECPNKYRKDIMCYMAVELNSVGKIGTFLKLVSTIFDDEPKLIGYYNLLANQVYSDFLDFIFVMRRR